MKALQNLNPSVPGTFYVSVHPSGIATEFQYNEPPKGKGGFSDFTNTRQRKNHFLNIVASLDHYKQIDSLWTFTIPYDQTNFEETDKVYTELFSKLLENLRVRHKRKQCSGLENYIWKAEAQERGAIHFHLISTSFLRLKTVRRIWNHLLKCDLEITQTVHVKRLDDVEIHNIGLYLAKYMSKFMKSDQEVTEENLKNRVLYCKSFNYTRNFPIIKPIMMKNTEFHAIKTEMLYPITEREILDKNTGEIIKVRNNPIRTITIKDQEGNDIQITRYYLTSKKALDLCERSRLL